MHRRHRIALATLALGAAAAVPAAATPWSRIPALPAADVYSLEAQHDTLLAGVDDAVWTSLDGGATWARSATLPVTPVSVEAARFAGGRLWAGTYGSGVFVSANRGASWQAANTGLTGGVNGSERHVVDLATRGDSLLAATDGAGVYALALGGPVEWSAFGHAFTDNVAGSVLDLETDGTRVLAPAGGNGLAFTNDRGDDDWTMTLLTNRIAPGLQGRRAAWTGTAWLVASQQGVHRSATGAQPWTATGPAGSWLEGLVVARGGRVVAAFNTLSASYFHASDDDGATWRLLDWTPGYTYDLALGDSALFVARTDGLWRYGDASAGVPAPAPRPLAIALAGAHPVRETARFRVTVPAGDARLEVFDAAGRLAHATGVAPGTYEMEWRPGALRAGVYLARLTSDAGSAVTKLVLAR
jgi:hypothetical protein